MILTPHAVVGAAIANMFPDNPALGFTLAFVSHYALDILPHTDYSINNFLHKESKTVKSIFQDAGASLHFLFIVFDFIFAVIFCILFFVRNEKSAIITLLGLLGGILPDFFQFLYYKYKNQPWIFFQMLHDKIHHTKIEGSRERILGILFQIFIPICFLVVYYLVKNKIPF